jgi:hypothetical protein
MPGSEPFFGVPGYQPDGSVRFNDDDSSKLTFTPQTAGNRKKWTFSCWVKRGNIDGESHTLFATDRSGSNDFDYIRIQTDDSVYAAVRDDSSNYHFRIITNRKLRDIGAWYHIVVRYDSTASTPASPENALYINGVLEDDLAAAVTPSQNDETNFNNIVPHQIGNWNADAAYYLDGYLAEVNFIDGLSLPASHFGETDGVTNQWVPIKYAGAYGTNGFYLPFSGADDVASATGGTITTDGDYKVHKFTSNGTFTLSAPDTGFGEVDILNVAGGGNGPGGSSSLGGGGGGAGGLRYTAGTCLAAGAYSVVVGAQGQNSSFAGVTTLAGGNGGSQGAGAAGGSGGGGVGNAAAGTTSNDTQGNNGGTGAGTIGVSVCSGGGGGGSGGVGQNTADNDTGNTLSFSDGGAGTAISITGSSVTYAAGGQGADHDSSTNGDNAAANTGSGGGGGGGSGGSGGTGAAGVVIIRYKFQ